MGGGRCPSREPAGSGSGSGSAQERGYLFLDGPLQHELGSEAAKARKPVASVALALQTIEQQVLDLGFDLDTRGYPCFHGVVPLYELPKVRFGAYAVFTFTAVSGRHRFSQQIDSPFWRRSGIGSGVANDQTDSGGLMGERWRMAYIALTAVVVTLAIASAIFSAARPKSSPSEALYTPRVTPSPSPSATFTLQPPTPTPTDTPSPSPTSTPVPTRTPRPSPTFTSYVVKTGQTLGAIARKFGVTAQAILAANPDITDPGRVNAGQILLIPPPGWAPSPSPSGSGA